MYKKFGALLISLILIFTLSGCTNNSVKDTGSKNTTNSGKIVFLYGARVFSTSLSDPKYSSVSISITTNMILYPDKSIERFVVSNISLNPSGLPGTIKNIKPKHILRNDNCVNWFLGPCNNIPDPSSVESEGTQFDYSVIKEGEANYLDEILQDDVSSAIYNVIVSDIAQIEPEKIETEKGEFYNNKILQYANIAEEQLKFHLTYKLEIYFEDGNKVVKDFEYTVNSAELLGSGYTSKNIELQY